MKRTNLTLNTQLLEEIKRAFLASTYSEAVNKAMEEVLRLRKIQELSEFSGSNIWSGDLSEMREDHK